MASPLVVYTDGSCLGNPGPGGWAAVFTGGENKREISGGEKQTTNNRMELTAAIRALQESGGAAAALTIVTDSTYVARGMTQWLRGWKRKNYRNSQGKPVKNADLWRELDALCEGREVKWQWTRGHIGNPNNERADELARAAAEKIGEQQ